MSFLLDTDICSAYLKNDRTVVGRVMLHYGALQISVISVGELLTWAMRANAPAAREQSVRDFLRGVSVLEVTSAVAEDFGRLRADLLDRGLGVGEMDLLIAATCRVHHLTLVTHNLKDYANIPGITLVDWLAP